MRARMFVACLAVICASTVWAQTQVQQSEPQEGQVQVDRSGPVPLYRITVVGRTTKAINYRHRSGPTKVDFRGTALMPQAKGVATVNSKQGRIEIDAKMEHLAPATQFGPEYLTYVMWAVTPEGRPKNLGEVLLKGDDSKLDVTTDLQSFGLIVTAEPYFAVTQPSDVVVMENFVRNDTEGTIETIDAKYELLQRGQYTLNVSPDLRPLPMDRKTPLELYEARNAVRIARWTGADRYASDTLAKAQLSLQNAEEQLSGKIVGKKTVAQNSREAAQMAEDARLITIRRMDEERLANERATAQQREAEARQRENQARGEQQQAESQRVLAERQKAEADQAKADAEAARARALAQEQAAQMEAERARQAQQQAEQEKAQLREQLREQLNLILETRETARGLIVNMSDVLFDTGKYTLKPGAREKLAKISGIILAHPGLRLEVEGHTDSVGGDEYNQRLSEQRAEAVRQYLVSQGVPPDSVTAQGFGKTRPVVSNATAAGRQQNRRVELVVSGDVIGASVGGGGNK